MKRHNFFLTILFLLALTISGCTYSTFYVPNGQNVYPPTDPQDIPVSAQKSIHTTYKELGRVAAIVWGGGESARRSLQREAARVGANAIIDLRIEKSWGRTSASGLAVFIYEGK